MALEFDKKFSERSTKDQLEYLHKLCDSQNEALDIMQKERNEWREKAKFYEIQLGNAQDAFDNQKVINHELMTLMNSDAQKTNEEIGEMVAYIGELGGDINRLGN